MKNARQPNNLPISFGPWPFYAPDELEAVQKVLTSGRVNYWTGQEGRLFEQEYAKSITSAYAIALNNGTAALELALHALDIPPGSEVITTPRTFIASASAAVMRGCIPVLADVHPDSGNITAETIAQVITPRTRAIIAVHLAGWPCDMDPIMDLAAQHGLKVIEDCAQANGATYKGRPTGSIGHMGAFSFCQDKIITTAGEGGMLTTNDQDLWSRAWSYKDHGKSFDAVYHKTHEPGFRWLHESFGTNMRMTEVQAAIGRLQLRKLPEWTAIRTANAKALHEAFSGIECVRIPQPGVELQHAWYKFYLYLCPERLKKGWDRDRIMNAINDRNIPCFSGSCSEIYREKAFTEAGFQPQAPLPNAQRLGQESLMFVIHPTLKPEDLAATQRVAVDVMQQACQ